MLALYLGQNVYCKGAADAGTARMESGNVRI